MNVTRCDQCGSESVYTMPFRLDYDGVMGAYDVFDFCGEDCLREWTVARLVAQRDRLRTDLKEEREAKRGKR